MFTGHFALAIKLDSIVGCLAVDLCVRVFCTAGPYCNILHDTNVSYYRKFLS